MRRLVLITGANKGIGLALVAESLAAHADVDVLLGSRDAARGEAARATLLAAHPDWATRVELLPLDVLSDDSVSAAAAAVRAKGTPLYAIVNNAGGGNTPTADESFALNFRGAVRVTSAFLPMLTRPGGRLVNVSSSAAQSFVSLCRPERAAQLIDPAITWDDVAALEAELTAALAAGTMVEAGFCAPASLGAFASSLPYFAAKALLGAYSLQLTRAHPDVTVVSSCGVAPQHGGSFPCRDPPHSPPMRLRRFPRALALHVTPPARALTSGDYHAWVH